MKKMKKLTDNAIEKKDKKLLIISGIIGVILLLGWALNRWYFVYKCNIITEGNYSYDMCYYFYNHKMPKNNALIFLGGIPIMAAIGFLVFCWLYLPQKAVGKLFNWLNKKR